MTDKEVLIVEDNATNRKILRDLLTAHQIPYLEAMDGEQGLKMAQEHLPSVILMDIQLPLIDGYEVTRRLKGDENTKDIPVVAVTSYAMKGEEERAREVGCDGYVAKPFNIRQVIKMVQSFLEKGD